MDAFIEKKYKPNKTGCVKKTVVIFLEKENCCAKYHVQNKDLYLVKKESEIGFSHQNYFKKFTKQFNIDLSKSGRTLPGR